MTDRRSLDDLLNSDYIEDDNDASQCRWCGHYYESAEVTHCSECKMTRKLRTLAELGSTLPIGVKSDTGTFNRQFEAIPITFAIEQDIRRRWGEDKQNAVSEHISTILAHTIKSVGGRPITDKKFEHRQLIFAQMFQADVLYMYTYVRMLSLGNIMTLKGCNCPSCRASFDYPCDLGTIEIVEFTPETLTRNIVLADGFKIGDKLKKKIVIGPPLWLAWGSQLPKNPTTLDMFTSMFSSSVLSIEDTLDGITVTDSEFMQLTKRDVDACEDALGLVSGGIVWEASGKCPECKEKFTVMLDWSYDRFFKRSYPLQNRRR